MKNIKAIVGLVIVVILVIAVVLGLKKNEQASSGGSADEKVIRVGTTAQTYPNSYKDDAGNLKGFDVELTEAVAKDLGYKVEWKIIGDVPGLLSAIDSKKIDTVANGITILPEREKLYDFSKPVGYYAAQIAVKTDSPYHSVADLEGKTVSGTLGSSNITLLEDYNSKVNIKTYDDRSAVFTDADKGTVDGVVNQRQFLQQTIKEQKLDLRIIDEVIGWNVSAYPFAKTKEGQNLKSDFNKTIKKLQKDGTITKLSKKYYGEDVSKKSE
ncbi:transporter substrate-binding domain-containing protein [Streptococcus dentasini]